MKPREMIEFLAVAERLKCNTRHSWTSTGRHESVAEHSWRLCLMAMLAADEFPEFNMVKVLKMCLIHDLGEAITGDIPAFYKTAEDEKTEDQAVNSLLAILPEPQKGEFTDLFSEMSEHRTPEARLYKSLDNLETLIQHNEADISTWLPLEYTANLIYGKENCQAFPYTDTLRETVIIDSLRKIEQEKSKG